MNDNHAETAIALDNIVSQQEQSTNDSATPTINPTTVIDPSGATIILNDSNSRTANITYAQPPSNKQK